MLAAAGGAAGVLLARGSMKLLLSLAPESAVARRGSRFGRTPRSGRVVLAGQFVIVTLKMTRAVIFVFGIMESPEVRKYSVRVLFQ